MRRDDDETERLRALIDGGLVTNDLRKPRRIK